MTDEITRQTAGMVASVLGWKVDTSTDYVDHVGCYLDAPDGARLFMRLDWRNKDRLTVSGVYPRDAHDATYPKLARHEIGVKRDRGPDVIAREIERRLLPAYLPELERARTAVTAAGVAADAQGRVVARILAAYRGATSDMRRADRISLHDSRDGGWYGDVDLYHDGSRASIELRSLPTGLALEVLAVLDGWQS